jgi:hypothetical protein
VWHADPLLGNDRETNKYATAVTKLRPVDSNKGIVFSVRSPPMAVHATMDAATEELCFLCGPCLDITSRTINKCSAVQLVQLSEVSCLVSQRTAAVQSL